MEYQISENVCIKHRIMYIWMKSTFYCIVLCDFFRYFCCLKYIFVQQPTWRENDSYVEFRCKYFRWASTIDSLTIEAFDWIQIDKRMNEANEISVNHNNFIGFGANILSTSPVFCLFSHENISIIFIWRSTTITTNNSGCQIQSNR